MLTGLKPRVVIGAKDSSELPKEILTTYIDDLSRVTRYYRWVGLALTVILVGTFLFFLIFAIVKGTYIVLGFVAVFEGLLAYLVKKIFDQVREYENRLSKAVFES